MSEKGEKIIHHRQGASKFAVWDRDSERKREGDHYNSTMLCHKPCNTPMTHKPLVKQRTLQTLGIFDFLWKLLKSLRSAFW